MKVTIVLDLLVLMMMLFTIGHVFSSEEDMMKSVTIMKTDITTKLGTTDGEALIDALELYFDSYENESWSYTQIKKISEDENSDHAIRGHARKYLETVEEKIKLEKTAKLLQKHLSKLKATSGLYEDGKCTKAGMEKLKEWEGSEALEEAIRDAMDSKTTLGARWEQIRQGYDDKYNNILRGLYWLSMAEAEKERLKKIKKDKRNLKGLKMPTELTKEQIGDAKDYLLKLKKIRVVTQNGTGVDGGGHAGTSSSAVRTLIELGYKGYIEIFYNPDPRAIGFMKQFFGNLHFPDGCASDDCKPIIMYKEKILEKEPSTEDLKGKNCQEEAKIRTGLREDYDKRTKKAFQKMDVVPLTIQAGGEVGGSKKNQVTSYEDIQRNILHNRLSQITDQKQYTKSLASLNVNERGWAAGNSVSVESGRVYTGEREGQVWDDQGGVVRATDVRSEILELRKKSINKDTKAADAIDTFVNKALDESKGWSKSPIGAQSKAVVKQLLIDAIKGDIELTTAYGMHNLTSKDRPGVLTRFAATAAKVKSGKKVVLATIIPEATDGSKESTAGSIKKEFKKGIKEKGQTVINTEEMGSSDTFTPAIGVQHILLPKLPKEIYRLLVRATSLPILIEGTGSAGEAASEAIPHFNLGTDSKTAVTLSSQDENTYKKISQLILEGHE
ncbi:MAG: hypothetical protein HQK51_19760 [Oligoflexia bacterium]|nr:hypothetical protein [Oligoflexia bacterium]